MRQISLSFSSIEAKNHKIDTEKHDNKDNGSFLPKKCCPPLSSIRRRCINSQNDSMIHLELIYIKKSNIKKLLYL